MDINYLTQMKSNRRVVDTELALLSELIGRASRISDGLGRYIEVVKTTLPQNSGWMASKL